jgi:alkylhydroperoxidase family enzyme
VLTDYTTAPISEAERVLFGFVVQVNESSSRITPDDIARVKAAGWSEEAVYDAVTVCALFNFYNRWIDATGVSDMPPEAYAEGGRRTAAHGYAAPMVLAPPARKARERAEG